MANAFIVSPKAENEILKSWEWYEEKQDGLGDRFKEDIRYKIKLIVSDPNHYPRKGKFYQANVDNFPYIIVFDINELDSMIYVISVFHTSRHPKKKY